MHRHRRPVPSLLFAAVLAALPACGIEQAGTGGGGGGGGNGGGGGGTVVGGGGTGSTAVPFATTIAFTATVTQVLSGDTIVLSDGTRIQYGDTAAPPAGTRCALDAMAQNAELVLDQVVGVSSCDPTVNPTAFADAAAPVRAHVVRMDVANLVPGTLTLQGWLVPDALTTCTQAAHDFYAGLAASAATTGAGINGPNCLEDPVGYGAASIDATGSVFDPPGDDIDDLNGEYVAIRAEGGHVDLSGWKLTDEIGYVYTFPSFVLYSGNTVRVHTGAGTDTATDLYWNLGLQAWNQTGDRVSLIDAEGRLIDSFSIG